MSGDDLYLRHILDAIGTIERYVSVGYETFMAESHWQDAVIRQLGIIGEAVKHLKPAGEVPADSQTDPSRTLELDCALR